MSTLPTMPTRAKHAFGAINATAQLVPVFTPDPRGWGMFSALSRRIRGDVQGERSGRFMPAPGIAGGAFHGDSRLTPQRFGGQAALGAGAPYKAGATDLQKQTSTLLADGPMKVYAERLRRTSGTGGVNAAVNRAAAS